MIAIIAKTRPNIFSMVTISSRINMPRIAVITALSEKMGITTDIGPLCIAIYRVMIPIAKSRDTSRVNHK
jgi:hypothetical protein